MKTTVVAAAMVFCLGSARVEAAETWVVDATHSGVGFAVRHMMISTVTGAFTRFEGKVTVDPKDITRSRIEAQIDVGSVTTQVPKRDEHLRSADFFDAASFPKMTFRSTRIQKVGKDRLKIVGDLTIRGKTQQVVLEATNLSKPVKDPWGKTRVGLQASTTIDRRKFGLSWNKALEAGGVLVDNKVAIHLTLQLIKS